MRCILYFTSFSIKSTLTTVSFSSMAGNTIEASGIIWDHCPIAEIWKGAAFDSMLSHNKTQTSRVARSILFPLPETRKHNLKECSRK